MFDEYSWQFKVAMVSNWLFPYISLALFSFRRSTKIGDVVFSKLSIMLFTLSFMIYVVFSGSYAAMSQMRMSIFEMAWRSIFVTSLLFPGLILILITSTLGMVFRPQCHIELVLMFVMVLWHFMYFASVIILTMQ